MQVLYYQTVRPQSKVSRNYFTELEETSSATAGVTEQRAHFHEHYFPVPLRTQYSRSLIKPHDFHHSIYMYI